MEKILIIEDEEGMVLSLEDRLRSEGYRVASRSDGKSGEKEARSGRYDLIILDVMMESATEGFQVSHKLRDPSPDAEYADYRDIPILMLTAVHTTTSLRFEPDEDYLPVEAFLEKSVDPDELLAKVEELLKS